LDAALKEMRRCWSPSFCLTEAWTSLLLLVWISQNLFKKLSQFFKFSTIELFCIKNLIIRCLSPFKALGKVALQWKITFLNLFSHKFCHIYIYIYICVCVICIWVKKENMNISHWKKKHSCIMFTNMSFYCVVN
jgi:hypothetical protein